MRSIFIACLGLIAAFTVSRAAESPALPPHPRLLATSADFDRIRESVTHDGPLKDAFVILSETVEREYYAPLLTRQLIGRRMLDTSRNAVRRILNGALLYRITGDKKWAARAEQEMLSVAAFSDWNPSHFLDTAEAATAVAIGYDWLYDVLSPESRTVLRHALVEQALKPGDSDQLGWRKGLNNWRQVCEAGLTLAALAVAEEEPELAARTIARARRNVPPIFETYAPDGAYVEGPMYWEYGSTFHVLLIEALRTATGSSAVLGSDPAFLQSASVVNILTGPSGDFFNYGDCILRRSYLPVMYWFARETRSPGIAAREHLKIGKPGVDYSAHPEKAPLTSRFFALSLLWMPAGPAATPVATPESWKTEGANPMAIFRRGDGRNSLYAGIKGGRARISHGHQDAGSFILELGGVRWTTDLGMPSYNTVEQAGISLFGKDRWKVFALNASSHSVPLIDDLDPDENATATLQAFSAGEQSALINLTPLYASQAKKLTRELRIDSADTVIIRDRLTGATTGAHYRFSWMTKASVETNPTGATLRMNGKTLRLVFSSDAAFKVFDEDASHPPADYDAPQPGLRRIGVVFTVTKPEHTLSVTARLVDQP
ncbi:heparinase II/III domain-containing protein [Rariglobus hedericola]|uniref:Heparinase n=1 Tax=Rariglobus hedericola TaxID=2597822 RepID=A0A556QJX3_9BACT|nr:heparinase II/III family protein [Rariglobus hedericola]TSJ76929.1 heparinase [Rariglobus hedericola]